MLLCFQFIERTAIDRPTLEISAKLTREIWHEKLRDPESQEYQDLEAKLKNNVSTDTLFKEINFAATQVSSNNNNLIVIIIVIINEENINCTGDPQLQRYPTNSRAGIQSCKIDITKLNIDKYKNI